MTANYPAAGGFEFDRGAAGRSTEDMGF